MAHFPTHCEGHEPEISDRTSQNAWTFLNSSAIIFSERLKCMEILVQAGR
jgi:hypothetical protein